jgi:MFS family permease
MATEHAPRKARGFFGCFPQMGSPIGNILSGVVFAWVTAAFSMQGKLTEAFFSYGWRIPFLTSAALVIVGLVIRLSVSESPTFERMRADAVLVKSPVRVALTKHWRTMILAAGTLLAVNIGYVYGTQILTYASGPQSHLHVPASQISIAIAIGGVVNLFAVALSGWLSDRFGRRIMALSGTVVLLVAAFPIYLLIDTALFPYVILGEIIAFISQGLVYGPLAALFCESFSGNVRYTAASIAYHGGAMIGGLSPVVATILLGYSHGESWVSHSISRRAPAFLWRLCSR